MYIVVFVFTSFFCCGLVFVVFILSEQDAVFEDGRFPHSLQEMGGGAASAALAALHREERRGVEIGAFSLQPCLPWLRNEFTNL